MRVRGARPALLVWVLVGALLGAVAAGEKSDEHEGHRDGHHGGPFGHEGHEDHEGHEGHHGPFGEHGHLGAEERDEVGDSTCTQIQTQAALKATANYIKCAFLDYAEFQALVHADVGILKDAAACFETKAKEIGDKNTPKDDMSEEEVEEMEKEIEQELATAFQECVKEAETEDTEATQATVEFLEKMLDEESTICACLPAFLIKMPSCEPWTRYHDVGMIIEDVCEFINNINVTSIPGPVDVTKVERQDVDLTPETESQDSVEVAEPPSEEKKAEEIIEVEPEEAAAEAGHKEEHQPHLPNTYGPCPPGQEVHPTNPKDCQPSLASEEEEFGDAPSGRNDRGGAREGGGLIGLGMSVIGVVAVGAVVGVGGVWAWGKFQSGTRQPGVRYMATGLDNNIGTELGPFGRQYA